MYGDAQDEFENESWGSTYKKQKVISHLIGLVQLASTEFIQTPKDEIFFK